MTGIHAHHVQGNRGRKPASESRAEEFRQRLVAWKRLPESSRPSMRALARELGTSHQLLGSYLKGWEKWQSKEYRRQACVIRARAQAENRPMSKWEEGQAAVYDRAATSSMIGVVMNSVLDKIAKRFKAGHKLSKGEIRVAKLLAREGFPIAQKIMGIYSDSSVKRPKNNLPLAVFDAVKSFR